MSNFGKRDYKLENVNKNFANWIKTNPNYSNLSMNKATEKLHNDIVSGNLTNQEIRQRADNLLKNIEDAIYGKKKLNIR